MKRTALHGVVQTNMFHTRKHANNDAPSMSTMGRPCGGQVRVRGAPKPGHVATEERREKRRLRKLLPSAWAHLGMGGDWDQAAQGAMPPHSIAGTAVLRASGSEVYLSCKCPRCVATAWW